MGRLSRLSKDEKSVPSLLHGGLRASSQASSACCLPAFATNYVLLLIGLWNVAAGLLQVLGAIVLRKEIEHGWLMALGGLIGAGLGALIMFYPASAAVGIIWIIAGTAVLVGLVLVAFALSDLARRGQPRIGGLRDRAEQRPRQNRRGRSHSSGEI